MADKSTVMLDTSTAIAIGVILTGSRTERAEQVKDITEVAKGFVRKGYKVNLRRDILNYASFVVFNISDEDLTVMKELGYRTLPITQWSIDKIYTVKLNGN